MQGQRKRVLLVDDDREIVDSMDAALRERGFDVLVARDGAEAMVRAERDAPDLIVLDVVMPKRSGVAVLEHIRSSHGRSPRIIMVTGQTEQRYKDFAESRGVDAFIDKPFAMDDFVSTVESLLKA
jgi:two-component system KDP operon response regulator KdpE